MPSFDNPAVPRGSLVLVTGTTGLIGSHVADQFLQYGYKVRGTTRNAEKNAWISRLFDDKYGKGQFELVEVADQSTPDAFDDVVRGAAIVVHCATELSLSPNPHEVVPKAIAMTLNALRAAAKEPSVKRFVLTSSSSSAIIPKPDTPGTITVDTWNDEAIEAAYRPPPYEQERFYPVYAASKALSEKEAWKFVREEKPGFVLNTVLPNINFGRSLDPINQGYQSTAAGVANLYKGDSTLLGMFPAQYFVDVQDNALLHVAAGIHPGVTSERIFAFAESVNGDMVLDILRKTYPEKTFPENFQGGHDLTKVVPRERAEELLRDMGRDGWTSLEESVRRNTEGL